MGQLMPFSHSQGKILDHLALYSRDCKRCKHLDPEEKKGFDHCHHTQGNPECPAKEVQFAVVGMARRAANQVKKARARSDLNREIEILKAVEKRSPAFQHKFAEELSQ